MQYSVLLPLHVYLLVCDSDKAVTAGVCTYKIDKYFSYPPLPSLPHESARCCLPADNAMLTHLFLSMSLCDVVSMDNADR